MALTIGVVAETAPGETRVALVPEVLRKYQKAGALVLLQSQAGQGAGFPDDQYAGAQILADAQSVLRQADLLLKVQPPTVSEIAALKAGATVVGYLQPHRQSDLLNALCTRGMTSFAMELVPRISRAQSMDALSSQAAVAGYKAVLVGANLMDKFLPMLTTAAGTVRPAEALILGAGVAGLQAIATARRLGAVVNAFDVRSATREQVQSLGARFVDTGITAEGAGGYARELTAEERNQQQAALNEYIVRADLVITTAAVPGRPSPRLIDQATVERMKWGAVIVDLGAEGGGNCAVTEPGKTIRHRGVIVTGPLNLPAELPRHASEMYARNLWNFLEPALADNALTIDWKDEVFASAFLTRAGEPRAEINR